LFFISPKCILLSVSCILFAVGPKFGNQPNKTCPHGNRLTAQAGWRTGKDTPVVRIFNYTCDVDNGSAVKVEKFKDKTLIDTLI